MKLYPLFLLMAVATVLSPGPGVVMTLTNSLRHGAKETFGGILGISIGALIVAAISATSLGILLAASALAFTIVKFLGAAYLVYLGIKLWRAPAYQLKQKQISNVSAGKLFFEGLLLQLTNPKVIFFFLSVFPQFIDSSTDYTAQFTIEVLSYCFLVILIHCLYALFARRARLWFTSEKGGCAMNRIGGATFMFLGAALATVRR